MVSTLPRKITASESVLLAADDLTTAGKEEFSEWDLTLAAWSRDRDRFGLRGYAQSYPDHKRVMMEIMGQKASSPIVQKYMTKVRPNYYHLTAQGRAAAARIRRGGGREPKIAATPPAPKPVTVKDLYDTVWLYASKPEFRRWQDNPEEPREWSKAAAFFGLTGKDIKVDPVERAAEIRERVRGAMDWCNVKEAAYLTRGSGEGGTPIHIRDLSDLLDFLQALTYRFPKYLEPKAGRAKKRLSDA